MNVVHFDRLLGFSMPRILMQALGVHLGIRHGPRGTEYGPKAMGEAVAELLRIDESVGDSVTLETSCPLAWEQLQRWLQDR